MTKPKKAPKKEPEREPKGRAGTHATHEEYFADAAPEARRRLEAIRRRVLSLVPDAAACISYRMPAFRKGKIFFYFAAFRNHIGIYPPIRKDARLIRESKPYRGEKGNLSFPLDEELPLDLIGRVALALAKEYGAGNG